MAGYWNWNYLKGHTLIYINWYYFIEYYIFTYGTCFVTTPDNVWQMKDRLRSPEEGADTAVWLAVSSAAVELPSGFFYQGNWIQDNLFFSVFYWYYIQHEYTGFVKLDYLWKEVLTILKCSFWFTDRKSVSTHLPLACTKVSKQEEEGLMTALENLVKKFADQ